MKTSTQSGAIVFGGARGIGAATATLFAQNGWDVVVADVLDDLGRNLATEVRVRYVHCDVSKLEQIAHAYDVFDSGDSVLKVVFNNVGIARYGRVEDLPVEDWELTMAVNVTSQFYSAKLAIPRLRKTAGGVIINTASILAHGSQKSTAAYSASKAAVLGLTRTIAIDHAREGIRCLSISPGTIDTPLVQIAAAQLDNASEMREKWADAHPLGRLGTPEEVAETVYFLAGPGAGFMTGSDILIDGGISSEFYK